MRYTILFTLQVTCILLFTFQGTAQKTAAYRDIEFTYRTAMDLYAKQKYSAAAKHFQDVVSGLKTQNTEMAVNAKYHVALCHMLLFRNDGEKLMLDFLRENPHASQCKTIYFILGKHYYQQKKYKKAIEYFSKVDKFDLNESEQAEYYFKWGHSNFQAGKKEEAIVAFNEIRSTENTWQKPAIYYYAHLSYEDKKYQAALENFLKIEKEPAFSGLVPYYIAQIYYLQNDYTKTIEYGVPLLDSVVPKREAELNLILGASYYNLKKYDQAYPYLDKYSSLGAPGREESYRIAYCALETKQYQKAINWFNKCVNQNDELTQTSWYHIGNAYLKLDKKEEARQTFSRCLQLEFNKDIQEEAHYNYVKLNYELSFNPYHDAINSVKTYFEKYPESKRKEELKTYLVHMFVAGKNYESAFQTLADIKNKDLALQRSYQSIAFNLGTDYFYKAEYEKARQYYAEVKKYPVDKYLNAESYYWMGESNYLQGFWDDAIQSYTRFLEEPGAINTAYYNRAQYNLGYCYMQKGYLSANTQTRSAQPSENAGKEHYLQSLVHFKTFTTNKDEKDNVRLNDAYLRMGDIYYIRADNPTALTYYDKAYSSGMAGSKDYALFQKAMCAGLTNKREEKISLLKSLLSNFKQSKYTGDAKFEIAETYRVMEDKPNAIDFYNKVIKEHADNFIKVKQSRYEVALIYYRNKDYALSEKMYTEILKDYPNQDDRLKALNSMRSLYADQGKMNEWLALMKQYGVLDKAKDKADSTYFENAEDFYFNGDYPKAIVQLSSYLEEFKPARFELQATYYLAKSYFATKDEEKSIFWYEKLNSLPTHNYTKESVRVLADYYYKKKEWQKSIDFNNKIENFSTDDGEILYSRVAQLRAHFELKNNSQVFDYAKKIIDTKTAKDDDKAKAYYYRAKMAFEQNNLNDAVSDFQMVEKLTTSEWKAEAAYTRCLIKYNKAEYVQTEKDLFAFFKLKPTYNYWMAKGFILLGDNYGQLGDTAQAKATLKSVIDKYDKKDDDIINIATEKLNKILEAEGRREEQRKMQINKQQDEGIENKNEGEIENN